MKANRIVPTVHLCVDKRLAKGASDLYGPEESGIRFHNLSGLMTAYAIIEKRMLGSQRKTKYSFGIYRELPSGEEILADLRCYADLAVDNVTIRKERVAFPLLGRRFDSVFKTIESLSGRRNEFDCLLVLLEWRFRDIARRSGYDLDRPTVAYDPLTPVG
jgi:hypothetical protein